MPRSCPSAHPENVEAKTLKEAWIFPFDSILVISKRYTV